MSYDKLVGQGNSGDFVFGLRDSSTGEVGTATEQGFGHVHKSWYKTTKSYDEGMEQLNAGKAESRDMKVTLDKVQAVAENGKFFMEIDGQRFTPTVHAVNQLASDFGTGTWYAQQLAAQTHLRDAEVLAMNFNHGKEKLVDTIKNSKRKQSEFIVRTRIDATMRAWLTAAYRPIDNRWFLETIAKIIPGGRLSHWRGDGDTIYGNVLIPDTIREEDDSDYGGMVSIGNCEIGTRRNSALPSVFRTICINGCIHNQTMGKAIQKVHRGKIDLVEYAAKMRKCITEQIPLITSGIDLLLSTKHIATDVSMKPVFCQWSLDNKLTPAQSRLILDAYFEEVNVCEVARNTLFGLVNAVTRAGQKLDNKSWVDFDVLGGNAMSMGENGWDSLTSRAARLDAKTVDEMLTLAT